MAAQLGHVSVLKVLLRREQVDVHQPRTVRVTRETANEDVQVGGAWVSFGCKGTESGWSEDAGRFQGIRRVIRPEP